MVNDCVSFINFCSLLLPYRRLPRVPQGKRQDGEAVQDHSINRGFNLQVRKFSHIQALPFRQRGQIQVRLSPVAY